MLIAGQLCSNKTVQGGGETSDGLQLCGHLQFSVYTRYKRNAHQKMPVNVVYKEK